MDVDKDFLSRLGNPLDDIPPKETKKTVDKEENAVEIQNNSAKSIQPRKVRRHFEKTMDDSDKYTGGDKKTEEAASFVIETEKAVMTEEPTVNTPETYVSEDNKHDNSELPFSQQVISVLEANISMLLNEVKDIKTTLLKFDGYDKAVETLKRSLAANQHNEENIYKELETYKKNQYFNYIRPFLEFLVNLLSDMISSKIQYEDDKTDFVASHGQEIFDEIIDLHDYYMKQIESQLQIQGVEIIHYEPETVFISTEQVINKTILTDNPEQSGKVGKVDSSCYKFEDKIIKKAKVHVYKFDPSKK